MRLAGWLCLRSIQLGRLLWLLVHSVLTVAFGTYSYLADCNIETVKAISILAIPLTDGSGEDQMTIHLLEYFIHMVIKIQTLLSCLSVTS